MHMMRTFAFAVALAAGTAGFGASSAKAEIKLEAVEYRDGDTVLEGTMAYDDSVKEPRPGVLVCHEWKGHGDYVKMRAKMLAEQGYVAFALDMYGKGVYAKDHEEAGKLSGVFFKDREKMRTRAKAGLAVLMASSRVDKTRVAAIGYCFGGTTALELARAGEPLVGVVSFHGNLAAPIPAKRGEVKAKIRVHHGAEDTFVPMKVVEEFKKEMTDAGVDYQVTILEGAVHSFTVKEAGDDKSKGMAYNEKADVSSWDATMKFLKDVFTKK
jgi:dienelactone hydrolase